MLSGIIRQAGLRLQAALGLDNTVVIFSMLAAASAAAAAIFASVSAFIWLAGRYDGITAGLVLAGAYLLVSLVSLAVCLARRRRNTRFARAQMSQGGENPLLKIDPQLLLIALQIGRSIGIRKLLPIAAVGFLAAMGGREWFGNGAGQQRHHG